MLSSVAAESVCRGGEVVSGDVASTVEYRRGLSTVQSSTGQYMQTPGALRGLTPDTWQTDTCPVSAGYILCSEIRLYIIYNIK